MSLFIIEITNILLFLKIILKKGNNHTYELNLALFRNNTIDLLIIIINRKS